MFRLSNKFALAIILVLKVGEFANTQAANQSPITIVALGDSTTAPRNVGAAQNGRPDAVTTRGKNGNDVENVPHNLVFREDRTTPWLYVYSDVLRDELPARGVVLGAVDNEGIGGTRTDEALARLRADVQAKSPDWVIVQFGINDSWWDSGQPLNLKKPDSSGSRVALDSETQTGGDRVLGNGNDHAHADRGNYIDNLTQIVRRLQASNARVILMTPNQISYKGDVLWRNLLLAQYAQAVRKISKSEKVACVDVWNLYENYTSDKRQSIQNVLLDSEHPNAIGHRIIASSLMDQIAIRPDKKLRSRDGSVR
jgi:lysophospholipase L1-like esterase